MILKFVWIAMLIEMISCISIMTDPSSVFTIAHFRYFRSDRIDQSRGCNKNIMYSLWTYPQKSKDALFVVQNMHQFGPNRRCGAKQNYAKVFGHEQDYGNLLKNQKIVASKIKTIAMSNIVREWKKVDSQLLKWKNVLQNILQKIQSKKVFVKVPASFLCKDVNGQPFILGLKNIKNIIVEMYGEDLLAYRTYEEIFSDVKTKQKTTSQYPDQNCPRFPSYSMLVSKYPNIQFYIEKTLQQEEPGFLGQEFEKILERGQNIYKHKNIFYDAYPPSLIRI